MGVRQAEEYRATVTSTGQVTIPVEVRRALHLEPGDQNADFGDACIVAGMEAEGATDIYSFDRGFDRYAGVRRLEP